MESEVLNSGGDDDAGQLGPMALPTANQSSNRSLTATMLDHPLFKYAKR